MQLLLGLTFAVIIALAAHRARALTLSGAASAAVIGTIVFGIGGWRWGLALIAFFVSSSGLSRWRRRHKEALGFEKTGRRDAAQVWANGGAATLCALLVPTRPHFATLLFLAALAAANADTWATEIGAAVGGIPHSLRTGRGVPPGTSGAVSLAGTGAAFAGAALLGCFALTVRDGAIVILAGFAGALFDSLLGATVQAQWAAREPGHLTEQNLTEQKQPGQPPAQGWPGVNNDVVNLLCTGFAVGAAALLTWLLPGS